MSASGFRGCGHGTVIEHATEIKMENRLLLALNLAAPASALDLDMIDRSKTTITSFIFHPREINPGAPTISQVIRSSLGKVRG
jgi:hypothetical protein